MSLLFSTTRRQTYHRAIPGARITPSGINADGSLPARWLCPRCGQHVENNGCHLVRHAPCVDCREFLREEYGDETRYDRRYPPLPDRPAFEPWPWPGEVEVAELGFPLARVGATIDIL